MIDENLGRVIATQDAVLLGRKSFDERAGFWPGSTIEPFASFINGVQKFVVTSTPLEPEWANTTVVAEGLSRLRHAISSSKAAATSASTGASRSPRRCSQLDLVDEPRLVVAPAVQARGRRLFDKVRADAGSPSSRSVTSPAG